MYGAFWCTHCFEQKQAFGVQAMQDFPYVECYPEGWQRVGACKQKHHLLVFNREKCGFSKGYMTLI